MSHELDTFADGRARMTYVGNEKPWHRLGQQATGNESLEEFMKLARGIKTQLNMESAYGNLGSGYRSTSRFHA